VARTFGAEVPFMRPRELSGDHTGTIDVIVHAIEWLGREGVKPEAVCCIYATAPFIRADDLKKGLTLLEGGAWQYVFSATTFAFPIFRAFQKNTDGGVQMFFPEHFNARSQDLPEALHDAGQFYWGRPMRGSIVSGFSSTHPQLSPYHAGAYRTSILKKTGHERN
jgi:N-acylneuraminate cytidylyltransferase